MPDISMCKGKDCPLKETCYRYTAESSDYQSYFIEVPYDATTNSCDYHMEIWNKTSMTPENHVEALSEIIKHIAEGGQDA
jgi:hypothetical protein